MRAATFRYCAASGWSATRGEASDSESTVVFVFGGPDLVDHPGPIAELLARFPNSHVIGCSTSGQIEGDCLFDGGLAVAATRFESTTVATASTAITDPRDSFDAGRSVASQLLREDLRAVFVLSNGHCVNGSELTRGLQETLPREVIVTGGLAGDGARFERTWVMHNGLPTTGQVAAVGFYGDSIRVHHGSEGGWQGFGPRRVITRSEGNVLYTLDGEPALPLYKRYLGEEAAGLPATALLYPLSIMLGKDSVVRTVLSIDEDANSMTFAGDVPQGAPAQFMMASGDGLIEGAGRAADQASGAVGAVLALAVSCIGRRLALGERTEEELEAVLETLPEGSALVGFYSYGELSPAAGLPCRLHNQTMTLTTLSEAA